jgi:NAD(P)H dehydrogenase (quinone)
MPLTILARADAPLATRCVSFQAGASSVMARNQAQARAIQEPSAAHDSSTSTASSSRKTRAAVSASASHSAPFCSSEAAAHVESPDASAGNDSCSIDIVVSAPPGRYALLVQQADRPPTVKILIVVYSRFGVVRRLSEVVAEGVGRVPGAQPELLEVADEPLDWLRPGETEAERTRRREILTERLGAADAVIVGSPAYFGSMASAVKRFFEDAMTATTPPPFDSTRPWHHAALSDKVGAAFTASATPHGGNELALHSILTMFMHLGMVVVTPGQADPVLENQAAPYGPTVVSGASGEDPPRPEDLEAGRLLGARVARIALWLKVGRRAYDAQIESGDAR